MSEFGNIRKAYLDLLGGNIAYRQYPSTGAGTGGVSLTTGNAVWGTSTALLAASTITTDFWFMGGGCYTGNANQVYNIQFFGAAATATTPIILEFTVDLTAGSTVNVLPVMNIFPIYFQANSALAARAGGAGNAKTINVFMIYATGL
jgi:hypothetical protein